MTEEEEFAIEEALELARESVKLREERASNERLLGESLDRLDEIIDRAEKTIDPENKHSHRHH